MNASPLLNRRTYSAFTSQPVPDELLRSLYDLCKWGPTSMNTQPMRVTFVRSVEAKHRLLGALKSGNVAKVQSAPVTAIVATDTRFYEMEPYLWHQPGGFAVFQTDPAAAQLGAFRNSSLQGGYFILAARTLGLDCGPLSGFDVAAVDHEFFPDGRWRSNFLCNLGYGDPQGLKPRNGRLTFDQACQIL